LLAADVPAAPGSPHAATPPAALSFNRDIRPILSENCFHCHGPDKNHREADLRLDDRDAAIEGFALGGQVDVYFGDEVRFLVDEAQYIVGTGIDVERRALVSTVRDGDDVLVRVTDTGAGIPADVQARVFEPYFSTKKAGTGLGLPTVRRIVEEHGGALEWSRPHDRTRFAMTLPAQRLENSAASAAEPSAS
jgi:hypothetical protein